MKKIISEKIIKENFDCLRFSFIRPHRIFIVFTQQEQQKNEFFSFFILFTSETTTNMNFITKQCQRTLNSVHFCLSSVDSIVLDWVSCNLHARTRTNCKISTKLKSPSIWFASITQHNKYLINYVTVCVCQCNISSPIQNREGEKGKICSVFDGMSKCIEHCCIFGSSLIWVTYVKE